MKRQKGDVRIVDEVVEEILGKNRKGGNKVLEIERIYKKYWDNDPGQKTLFDFEKPKQMVSGNDIISPRHQ